MLQDQRIEVGAHHQVDGCSGFIQRRLALEVASLPAFLQDIPQQRLQALLVHDGGLPAFGCRRGGDLVELSVLEKETQARLHNGFEHAPQLLGWPIGLGHGRPDLALDIAQAVGANHLADGLLGFEELVDIGFGKTDLLGQVGHGGFFVAVAAEVLGGGGHDLVSHLVVRRAPACGGGMACFGHGQSLRQS
ncbi:hypothetical protein D3C71_1184170 [compost metagenome]